MRCLIVFLLLAVVISNVFVTAHPKNKKNRPHDPHLPSHKQRYPHCFFCPFRPCSGKKLPVCMSGECRCMKIIDIILQKLKLGYEWEGFDGPDGTVTTTVAPKITLELSGPSQAVVCPAFPPGYNGTTAYFYPQLTFTVTNAAAGLPLIFDLASNSAPVAGLGAPNGPTPGSGPGENWSIYSPTILSGDEDFVFVSNLNVVAGKANTDTTGFYGAGNNGGVPCGNSTEPITVGETNGVIDGSCCQMLRFSVSPGVTITNYKSGYKDVKVCFDDPATCTVL